MATTEPTKERSVNFTQLLDEAVTKPGTLMRAYSLFWNYSLGNQILALIQANNRGIALGPIASFNRWKELGRYVKRGERAIELCMPVTCKRTVGEKQQDGTEAETEITFKRFVFRRNWFMLAQTDGAAYQMPAIPAWDRARALQTLNVEEIPFEMLTATARDTPRAVRSRLTLSRRCPRKPRFTNWRTSS